MKHNDRRFIKIASAMLLLVCLYQLYWLVGQYRETKSRMEKDINEVLRSADFEELVHRVDEISRMDFKGKVGVMMTYDHEDKGTLVKSDVEDLASESTPSRSSDITVSPATFGSVLRTPDDLVKIGLNMQRGIHLSLDRIKEVDLIYLDRLISEKLDSLGLGDSHTLLYITPQSDDKTRLDTLAKIGSLKVKSGDVFSLELPGEAEYRMIIPQWRLTVIGKMLPAIIFSLITLVLLCVAFLYLIKVVRRQKELEEIKTDFTNNITHELKTPIAVAYAANDALLNFDSSNNTPRMQRYLTICQDQLRLLDRLVEQILSLSMKRQDSFVLNIEPVDLPKLFNSLCEIYKMKYSDSVNFAIDMEPNFTVDTDLTHLSNILGNIIDNAIKYSKGRANIVITARKIGEREVEIDISDNGIGMTQEQIEHIFDRFYRVPHGNRHDVKGYGLGLFYVKSMTEKLGGAVSVKSIPGKGSTFTLKFHTE